MNCLKLKKIAVVSLLFFFSYLTFAESIFAAENPLGVPNNKFGIHILFPEELDQAARLVNSNGGDWGYVTIPIQASDKNLGKWQAFMDKARALHIIPIIRLATVPYYFNTSVWQKPTFEDVLDFANFLNSLNWPTQNRYIVVYNEPNRNDEWNGKSDPFEYAEILNYAVDIFKQLDPDFFIISAGLDNGADTNSTSINQYEFLEKMNFAAPLVFKKLDGLASHSYPNPGFSQAPWVKTVKNITSFLYERDLIGNLSGNFLPVFITETGWNKNVLSDTTIANYYKNAFSLVWKDENIVAITPFLLEAGTGPFSQFSFFDNSGKPNAQYEAIKNTPKIQGKPLLSQNKADEDKKNKETSTIMNFYSKIDQKINIFEKINTFKIISKWLLRL